MKTFKLNQINVDPMPNVEGVTFRTYQGKEDHPALVQMLNRVNEYFQKTERQTLKDFDLRFSNLRNCNAHTDMILCEVNGRLVASGRIAWAVETSGVYQYAVRHIVDPEFKDSEIPQAILQWVEKRARQIAAEHPADAPKRFEAWATKTETDKINMLQESGYEVVRYFYDMTCDLSEPIEVTPMPEGLEVKPVTPQDYRKVWEASNEAFHDHWGDTEYTEEDFQRFVQRTEELPSHASSLWKIGWDGDQVAGMVLNQIDHEENEMMGIARGYTDPICVRRPWRKRGLASALISRSLVMLKEMGMTEAALGVDAENPSGALGLYQRHGFRTVQESRVYHKLF